MNITDEVTEAMEMLGKGYNHDPIPPTKFVATVSGFTLAPDVLINEYGYVTALVWGVTWRFCQMADGVCRASLEKIAGRLGMSERTIIRHLDTLCEGGYLFDTTPELKNKPHIYADTGKIRVRVNLESRVTESQRAMTQSQRQGDRESVEESIKKQTKKQEDERDSPDRQIFTALESLIGPLNSNTPKFVDTWLEEHSVEWILKAIKITRDNNARSLKYIDEILIGWEANGYPKTREEKVQSRKQGNKHLEPKAFEGVREFLKGVGHVTGD
jgi:DnaD/phage-associated family protein